MQSNCGGTNEKGLPSLGCSSLTKHKIKLGAQVSRTPLAVLCSPGWGFERTRAGIFLDWLVGWLVGCLLACLLAWLVAWLLGCLVAWLLGLPLGTPSNPSTPPLSHRLFLTKKKRNERIRTSDFSCKVSRSTAKPNRHHKNPRKAHETKK